MGRLSSIYCALSAVLHIPYMQSAQNLKTVATHYRGWGKGGTLQVFFKNLHVCVHEFCFRLGDAKFSENRRNFSILKKNLVPEVVVI